MRVASLVLALSASLLSATAAADVDLLGTWYVLVHYTDASRDADIEQWEDKIWVFEQKGSRLRWSEYPIVIFEDESTRYGTMTSGRASRVEAFWLPSSEQRQEIRDGLKVSARSAKIKTLRAAGPGGYRSSGPAHADSASVIGYSETWEVRDLEGVPVFVRSALMGATRTEDLTGETSYRSETVSDAGRHLVGSFERDGVERGSFQMMRAGKIALAGKKVRRGNDFD